MDDVKGSVLGRDCYFSETAQRTERSYGMLGLIEVTVAAFEVGHDRSCNDIASTALLAVVPPLVRTPRDSKAS